MSIRPCIRPERKYNFYAITMYTQPIVVLGERRWGLRLGLGFGLGFGLGGVAGSVLSARVGCCSAYDCPAPTGYSIPTAGCGRARYYILVHTAGAGAGTGAGGCSTGNLPTTPARGRVGGEADTVEGWSIAVGGGGRVWW
jgi:hypothetical protein